MNTIAENLATLRECVSKAEQQCGRQAHSVKLLAVSKTHSVAKIKQALDCGQHCFGENYVQEALPKINQLQDEDIEWHFIGPIQANKCRAIAQHFAWVHGLDREKIAQRLNDYRPPHAAPLNVCIQVNLSQETTKAGVLVSQVLPFAAYISKLPKLRLRGLMLIPAPSSDESQQRKAFAELYQLQNALLAAGYAVDTLSMGMSADYPAAIAEGATLIRIGTGVFGLRL